ncbi:MAG: InlB B-repeat-containing protein, partial [Treponema sp.]|nr:InlB B-repeat-containing protein [Treponema sp.]
MNGTRKVTTGISRSVRLGLLAFAAAAFIGFGVAGCGDTPGGDNGGTNTGGENNGNSNGTNGGKKEYAITFNDGYGAVATPNKAKQGDTVKLSIGTRADHGFNGWTVVKPASGVTITDHTFTMPDEAVVIAATWEQGAYDIIVNQGGGTGSKVNNNKYSARPEATVKLETGTYDGYTFDGWTVVKPEGGLTITSDNTFTMPAEIVEVTAKWTPIDYTITIDQNGGSGATVSKSPANVGETITLTPGSLDGYTFDRWTVVSPDTVTMNENTFTMPASHVEVKATWKGIDYTITIDQNGGSGSAADKTTANIGETITLTPGTYKDGYKFDSWTVVMPDTLEMSSNTFTMPAAHVKVMATWKAIDYTISINENGGSGSAVSKNPANVGDEITLTPGRRGGYAFDGWTDVSPNTVTMSGNTFTMPASNVAVTATWTAVGYTITIDENGGSGSAASKSPAHIGEKVTLTPGNRVGYTFDGWTVVQPAGLTVGTDNTFTMQAADVEVAAKWKAVDYTISINENGGSGATASKNPANIGDVITMTPGNRTGYTFDRWTVSPSTVTMSGNTFTMPASSVAVTAEWKAIDYAITIDQNSGSGATASKNPANIGNTITLTPGSRLG